MPKGKPDKVPKLKLSYKGIFDLNLVYMLIHQFLMDEGWKSKSNPQGDDYEVYYLEKGDDRISYIIKWEAEKIHNEYMKFYMDVTINGRNLSKQEVMLEGKKATVDSGEIVVEIQGSIESDWKGNWEKHWALKHFQKYYERKLEEDLGGDIGMPLYEDINDLYNLVKGHLKLRGGEYELQPLPKRPG